MNRGSAERSPVRRAVHRAAVEALERRQLLAATLIKDVNAQPSSDYQPYEIAPVGGVAYFGHNDGSSGYEVWKSDGTAAGTTLVKDVLPGQDSSFASSFTPVGGTVFFVAETPASGDELWKTNGTAAGTVLVKDINPGPASSVATRMTAVGSLLYFYADNGVHGRELWKSDGTAAGTVMVRDVRPGAAGQTREPPGGIAAASNGTIFFDATDGTNHGIWKTDGTAAGTAFVKARTTSPARTFPIVTAGSRAYFTDLSRNLWRTDGTTAGTVFIDSSVGEMVAGNGALYYVRDGFSPGLARIRSADAAPTLITGPFSTTSVSNLPPNLTVVGNRLYFSAVGTNVGRELFSHLMSGNIAELVKDVRPGPNSSNPSDLVNVNGTLSFTVVEPGVVPPGGAITLWRSGGAEANTNAVAVINDGKSQELPDNFAGVGNRVLFVNDSPASGREIWASDGTAAGTGLVRDLYPGTDAANPTFWGRVGSRTLFTANDGASGFELWGTDGTAAGTTMLADINPGAVNSSPQAWRLANGKVYFAANRTGIGTDIGTEPWVTDGTPAGTFSLGDLNEAGRSSFPSGFTALNGTVYFVATDFTRGTELWKTDGTPGGAVLVKDITPGSDGSAIDELVASGGVLYFTARTTANGTELWRSDGTPAGTVLVKDIFPGTSGSTPHNLTAYGGAVYFTATDAQNNNELWRSDGTAAGTVQVKDIAPGATRESSPQQFTVSGGVLYFTADDRGATGREVWRTDGTAAGTVLVKDVRPGAASSSPLLYEGPGGRLFFFADDGAVGRELWATRGTADTTALVKDITPGPAGTRFLGRGVASGGRFFFASDGDPAAGLELWSSDGTAAGTALLQDMHPGSVDGTQALLVDGGDALYFSANDGVRGFEPYRVADTFAPAAWSAEFDFRGRSRVVLRFNEGVADLTASDLVVTHLTTGERVPPDRVSVSYDAATHSATFTFPGYPGGVLPDGNYRATLPAGAARDPSGNATATEASVDFYVLQGDINRDRRVDSSDFALLAGNFGRTGMTYGQGDLNGDGRVDSSDFALLAGNFGKSVPAPQAALTPLALPSPPQSGKPAAAAPVVARHGPVRRAPARRGVPGRGRLGWSAFTDATRSI